MATALPPRQPGHRPATITTSRHTLTPALATLVTTFWSRVRDQEGNTPPPPACPPAGAMGCVEAGGVRLGPASHGTM